MDQRKYPRVPFSESVLLNKSVHIKGINISEGGLFVHGRDITPGSILNVSFKLDSKEISLNVKVSNSKKSVGMGLTFVDLGEAHRCEIRNYVEKHSREAVSSRKRKVLLVEDNVSARKMNKNKLVCDGCFVIEANDGIDAISSLEQCLPDLVVLDLYMERMNGFKVLAYMKGNFVMKNIPVIVLSGRGHQAEIDRVMSLGADAFLVKMVTSPAKLSECVAKFFK